jgi:GNAT superfamily N-acetyltransferase
MEKDKLVFRQVKSEDTGAIDGIFQILCRCGEDMYLNQGLSHWKTPYPKETIRQSCSDNAVFLVEADREEVASFQIVHDGDTAHLVKFAVVPKQAGKGIGNTCLQYIFQWSRERNIAILCGNVYEKSTQALSFYVKNGFEIVGSSTGKRFTVYLIEKMLL